ncbi:hypothetical protein BU17DRAFT_50253 [Hysterangium stoloniferum]|nr:hypothetical protein BU17DRAFT_50253 [Hysterangium stoloniferum]
MFRVYSAFRSMIPEPADRVNIDSTTWPYLLQPIPPLLCMAYLVQRPNTRLLRILIFPIVLFTSLRSIFYYVWVGPQFADKNIGKAYLIFVFCLFKAVDLAFYGDRAHRFCESPRVERSNPTNKEALKSPAGHVVDSIKRTLYIICTSRGVGLKYGESNRYPVEFRPLEKKAFLLATFMEIIKNLLLADLTDTIFMLNPNVIRGRSIFIPSLPWPTRYMTAIIYHLLSMNLVKISMKVVYYTFTLIGVGILSQPTQVWPPLFHPYPFFTSHSLHDFWSTKWHQLIRRLLHVWGGYPVEWIAMRFGLPKRFMTVLGIYIVSGFFHQLTLYATGHELNTEILIFFIAHGFFMEIEYQWGRLIKKHVGGLWGSLWVFCTVHVLGAKLFSDPYFVCGVAGASPMPPRFSPIRRIAMPALLYIAKSCGWI